MININRVVLVGRLTKDPDLRKTQSNLSVCQFTLAVDRLYKKDEADFISCVAWKQSADFLAQFASKGTIVSVDGRIQTRSYESDKGMVYITEVIADNIQLIPSQQRKPEMIEKEDTSKFGGYASESGKEIIETSDLPFY